MESDGEDFLEIKPKIQRDAAPHKIDPDELRIKKQQVKVKPDIGVESGFPWLLMTFAIVIILLIIAIIYLVVQYNRTDDELPDHMMPVRPSKKSTQPKQATQSKQEKQAQFTTTKDELMDALKDDEPDKPDKPDEPVDEPKSKNSKSKVVKFDDKVSAEDQKLVDSFYKKIESESKE